MQRVRLFDYFEKNSCFYEMIIIYYMYYVNSKFMPVENKKKISQNVVSLSPSLSARARLCVPVCVAPIRDISFRHELSENAQYEDPYGWMHVQHCDSPVNNWL